MTSTAVTEQIRTRTKQLRCKPELLPGIHRFALNDLPANSEMFQYGLSGEVFPNRESVHWAVPLGQIVGKAANSFFNERAEAA